MEMINNIPHHAMHKQRPPCFFILVLCLFLSLVSSIDARRACNIGNPSDMSEECVCNPGSVRCINIQPPLEAVPTDILPDVTALALTNNKIQLVEGDDFLGLEEITTLFLQDNEITYIHPNAFRNLYKLNTLSLERNKLGHLDPQGFTFQHLPSINSLALQSNEISYLNKFSFFTMVSSLSSVSVKLNNNPVQCDCDVKAIRNWEMTLPQNRISFEYLRCANDNDVFYNNADDSVFGNCDSNIEGTSNSSLDTSTGEDNNDNNNNKNKDKIKENNRDGEKKEKDNNRDGEKEKKGETSSEIIFEDIVEGQGNRSVDNASLSDIFDTMVVCPVCNNERTNQACNERPKVPCIGSEMVCQQSLSWDEESKNMTISSGCSKYMMCLDLAINNKQRCGIGYQQNGNVDCNFCCIGPTCLSNSIGGRTADYTFVLIYARRSPYEMFMQDKGSKKFLSEQERIAKGIRSLIINLKGGMDVYVQRYEPLLSGQHKVLLRLELTVFNTEGPKDVADTLKIDIAYSASGADSFLVLEGVPQQSLYLATFYTGREQCTEEETETLTGNILWEVTNGGLTVNALCPLTNPLGPVLAFASRECLMIDGVAEWGPVDDTNCSIITDKSTTTKPTRPTEKPEIDIDEIIETDITTDNAHDISGALMKLTSGSKDYTPERLSKVVDVLDSLATEEFLKVPGVMGDVVGSVSNLMEVDEDTLKLAETEMSTSKRLLQVIDKVPERAPLTEDRLTVVTPNLAVAAQGVRRSETRDIILSSTRGSDDNLTGGRVDVGFDDKRPPSTPGKQDTKMVIPTKALIDSLPASQKSALKRVSFSVHQTDKLFASMEYKESQEVTTVPADSVKKVEDSGEEKEEEVEPVRYVTRINSNVVSATVPGVKVQDLSDNVTMTFDHAEDNSTNPHCVFWDQSVSAGKGGWSSDGCYVVESGEGQTTCGCDHLTNFALLMDVYQEGSNLSDLDREILSIISYIGCAVSLVALLLTLITYSLFRQVTQYNLSDQSRSRRKLRRDNPSKILVNLCLALLLSNLVYLVGMHDFAFDNNISCKVVAVLLHYFLLASLSWMAVEAFYMYLALVLVFKTYFTNFILKCSLVGWGVPLVIVAVTLGVNTTDNYGFINSGLCWLKNPAFFAAFVGPVCLILVINCIAFGLVVKQLVSMSSNKLNKTDKNSTVQRLRGAVGVVILLGLSWLFAVFAIDQASVVFYYLFAIFNSLQGLFIFVFYCLLKKDAMTAWKRSLPCFEEYGDTSKSSSNSRAASATATVNHTVKGNKYSKSSTGNTASSDLSDSRKNSYFNSVNSSNMYNTIDEDKIKADTNTGDVKYVVSNSPHNHQAPAYSVQNPTYNSLNEKNDPENIYKTPQTPTTMDYSTAKPSNDGDDFYSKAAPISPVSQSSGQNFPPEIPVTAEIKSPLPSAPLYSYLKNSNTNSPSQRAEGEIDSSNTAKVNDIRLKFEKNSS